MQQVCSTQTTTLSDGTLVIRQPDAFIMVQRATAVRIEAADLPALVTGFLYLYGQWQAEPPASTKPALGRTLAGLRIGDALVRNGALDELLDVLVAIPEPAKT